MWLARDKDGYTALWSLKPIRIDDLWCIDHDTYGFDINKTILISEIKDAEWLFPELTWNDDPLEINIIPIKNNEKD